MASVSCTSNCRGCWRSSDPSIVLVARSMQTRVHIERANPSASQTAYTARPWATRASAHPLFFGDELHGFLEEFVLQGLLAQDPLQLGDPCACSCQLGRGHHRLDSERAPARPLSQVRATGTAGSPPRLPGSPPVTLTCLARTCIKPALPFPRPTAACSADRSSRSTTGSLRLVILTALLISIKDGRWTASVHSGGQLTPEGQ